MTRTCFWSFLGGVLRHREAKFLFSIRGGSNQQTKTMDESPVYESSIIGYKPMMGMDAHFEGRVGIFCCHPNWPNWMEVVGLFLAYPEY